jgi:hypothetical protein
MIKHRGGPHDLRQLRPWISAAVALSFPFVLGAPAAAAAPLVLAVTHFQFEQQAHDHCPNDAVVWAVARSGIYNSHAERWYGQTSDGTYVCRKDAEAAGYHSSRASQ